MKKIVLLLVFTGLFSISNAQETRLDYLKSKLSNVIGKELIKYDKFGSFLHGYDYYKQKLANLVIIDAKTNKDGKIIIKGEFTYRHNSYKDNRTLKYEATVKGILDDLSVIKVIYQDPKDEEWYRLFPANDF